MTPITSPKDTSNFGRVVLRRYLHNIPAVIAGIFLLFLVMVALFGEYIMPNDPNEVNMAVRLINPCKEYPLGTDAMGRCILSRIIDGTGVTLGNAITVMLGILCIGVPLGLVAGYVGGKVDNMIMRMVDIVCTFPSSLVALAVVGIAGPGLQNVMLVLMSLWWAPLARMVRGEVLQIKEKEFIMAAEGCGTSTCGIMFGHILKNVMSPIIVYATLRIGAVIMHIASFSFIGLGTQPPAADWGVMLSDGKDYLRLTPNVMLWPGLAMMLTVFALNIWGEGLGEAFKPIGNSVKAKRLKFGKLGVKR